VDGGKHRTEAGWPAIAKVVAVAGFFAVLATILGLLKLLGVADPLRYLKLCGGLLGLAYWPLTWIVLSRRYGDQRTAREQVLHERRQAKANRIIYGGVIPVLMVALLVVGLVYAGPAWPIPVGFSVAYLAGWGVWLVRRRPVDR
jgi:hypothetical protein